MSRQLIKKLKKGKLKKRLEVVFRIQDDLLITDKLLKQLFTTILNKDENTFIRYRVATIVFNNFKENNINVSDYFEVINLIIGNCDDEDIAKLFSKLLYNAIGD